MTRFFPDAMYTLEVGLTECFADEGDSIVAGLDYHVWIGSVGDLADSVDGRGEGDPVVSCHELS